MSFDSLYMSQLRCSFICAAVIDSIYFDVTKHAYLKKKLPQLTGVKDCAVMKLESLIVSCLVTWISYVTGKGLLQMLSFISIRKHIGFEISLNRL